MLWLEDAPDVTREAGGSPSVDKFTLAAAAVDSFTGPETPRSDITGSPSLIWRKILRFSLMWRNIHSRISDNLIKKIN